MHTTGEFDFFFQIASIRIFGNNSTFARLGKTYERKTV